MMKTLSISTALACILLVGLFSPILSGPSPAHSSFYGFTMTPSEVPPTPTPAPPTETPAPPTDTPAPPTETPVALTPLPTDTSVPLPTAEPETETIKISLPELPLTGRGRPELSESLDTYSVLPSQMPGEIALPTDDTQIRSISIPDIDLKAPVTAVVFNGQTWDISQYHHTVAWLAETSLPGQGRNTVLSGHVTAAISLTPVFARLKELRPGSVVQLETSRAVYTYIVREQRLVVPTDLSILEPSISPQVTLITCTGWDESLKTFTLRRIIVADLMQVHPKTEDQSRDPLAQ